MLPELRSIERFPVTQDDAKGTFSISGVPPGRWQVVVLGTVRGKSLEGWAWASAGDDVAVVLGEK